MYGSMDTRNYTPPQVPTDQFEYPLKKKGQKDYRWLLLIRLGFAEITIVSLFLLVTLGTLHYFNITPLDNLFPQLSVYHYQAFQKFPDNFFTALPPSTSNPQTIATELSRRYIQLILPKSLQPNQLALLPANSYKPNVFSSFWKTSQGGTSINEFSLNFIFEKDKATINEVTLSINTNQHPTSLDANLAKKIVSRYIYDKINAGVWDCESFTPSTKICQENIFFDSMQRIIGVSLSEANELTIFTCAIPKQSKLYKKIIIC